jgi:uncharacterized protein (UPF0333 family)
MTTIIMITNKEVFDKGDVLEHYPCDVDENKEIQPNGSIENIVLYNGKKYYIVTDWENNVRWGNEVAQEVNGD